MLKLTNKSLFSEHKWDWFENRVSGDTGWGNSRVDHGLGNERGKNSFVENGFQGGDLTPGGGGGAKIKFMKHLPNALSYLQKGLRDVTDAIDQYNNIRSVFGDENTNEMDTLHGNFNPNLPGMPQSFIDSVRQSSFNKLSDTLDFGYRNFGYKNNQKFSLPTAIFSKDSIKWLGQGSYDSIKREKIILITTKLKKKK